MESMRTLNRSLPASNPPTEELLRVFKAAAFSVTNLYREASSNQTKLRAAGYQDALDDLLAFLDKRNIGIGDGEGWQVRQWATERLEDRPGPQQSTPNDNLDQAEHQDVQDQQAGSESDEDKEIEKEKSPSPIPPDSSPIHPTTPQRLAPPQDQPSEIPEPQKPSFSIPASSAFNFASTHSFPQEVEMQSEDVTNTNKNNERRDTSPRTPRRKHTRPPPQKAVTARLLGAGGGSKRRMPFSDFFDISSIDAKEGGGRQPSKRGRTG